MKSDRPKQLSQKQVAKMLEGGEWELFISRSFSLFTVSLWHYCYEKYLPLITEGKIGISDGVFVQDKDGVVDNYRKSSQIDKIKNSLLRQYKIDRRKILNLLKQSNKNRIKIELLLKAKGKKLNFQRTIDIFCKEIVFGVLLPHFLLDLSSYNQIDNEIINKCLILRKESIYPKILSEVVIPKLAIDIKQSREITHLILLDEVLNKRDIDLNARLEHVKKGRSFIYFANKNKVKIIWNSLSKKAPMRQKQINGQVAFPGKVVGKVSVSNTFDGNDLINFAKNDILVSLNANPGLLPFMKKASAIIVNEGVIGKSRDNGKYVKFSESIGGHPFVYSDCLTKANKDLELIVVADQLYWAALISKIQSKKIRSEGIKIFKSKLKTKRLLKRVDRNYRYILKVSCRDLDAIMIKKFFQGIIRFLKSIRFFTCVPNNNWDSIKVLEEAVFFNKSSLLNKILEKVSIHTKIPSDQLSDTSIGEIISLFKNKSEVYNASYPYLIECKKNKIILKFGKIAQNYLINLTKHTQGSLCHGASLSKMLRIPCIIGTGNATKILKNGDMVEVDAHTGVIRIL